MGWFAYGGGTGSDAPANVRYSPAVCTGIETNVVAGCPDMDRVSTSYVERFNLETRMHNRRFTRLTNGFSKKQENHAHAIAIQMMVYNFVRLHGTTRVTPAMAAGVTDRAWDYSDVVALLDTERIAEAA